jgi:hypothetical protein
MIFRRIFGARALWLMTLVIWVVGGLGAVSCAVCRADDPPATLTLTRERWAEVMRVLTERRLRAERCEAERESLQKQLAAERNACASKLANERILQAQMKQAKSPDCTGWKVATGACGASLAVCGIVLGVREVTR